MASRAAIQTVSRGERGVHGLSLRQNFAWTLAGNLVYAGCQWGMLISIAKLGSPAMVGQFALGLAITAPVFLMAQLQLRAVQATDARYEFSLGHYMAVRVLGTVAALVVVAGIVSISGYRRETSLVVLIVGLAKSAEGLSDVVYGFWQKHERLDQIALAMAGRGLGSLVALGMVLHLTRNIVLSVAAMALWWALWFFTYERRVARRTITTLAADERLGPAWEPVALGRLAWLSLPLGLVAILLSLNANMPRYFVEHYLGEAALGYFAAIVYIYVAGNTLTAALGQSATPRLARYYLHDRRAFVHLLVKMACVVLVAGSAGVLVVVVAGRAVLSALYRPEYAAHAPVFTWIMIAGAIGYVGSIFGYGMTAARRLRAQVPLFAGVTACNALACWLWVPRFGLRGAAYALTAAAVLGCVGAALISFASAREPTFSGEPLVHE